MVPVCCSKEICAGGECSPDSFFLIRQCAPEIWIVKRKEPAEGEVLGDLHSNMSVWAVLAAHFASQNMFKSPVTVRRLSTQSVRHEGALLRIVVSWNICMEPFPASLFTRFGKKRNGGASLFFTVSLSSCIPFQIVGEVLRKEFFTDQILPSSKSLVYPAEHGKLVVSYHAALPCCSQYV